MSGAPFYNGAMDIRIVGDDHAEAIRFRAMGRQYEIAADIVALHDGVVPNDNLAVSFGARSAWNEERACYELLTDGTTKAVGLGDVWVAGDSAAISGGYQATLTGRLAALDVALARGFIHDSWHASQSAPLRKKRERLLRARRFIDAYYAPSLLPAQARDETLLCRCEEVSIGHIRRQVAEGAAGTRAVKAGTRCGMGPCQGRQCTVSLAAMLHAECPGRHFERPSLRCPARPITVAELAESHHGLIHSGSDA
jgi:NAD(P)H-nitrite reductase large subunit